MSRDKIIGRPMEILLVEDDLEDAGLTIETLHGGGRPAALAGFRRMARRR